MRLSERRHVEGLNPQRADIFPGGLIVIDEALAMLDMQDAMVSTGDLLLGYVSAN